MVIALVPTAADHECDRLLTPDVLLVPLWAVMVAACVGRCCAGVAELLAFAAAAAAWWHPLHGLLCCSLIEPYVGC